MYCKAIMPYSCVLYIVSDNIVDVGVTVRTAGTGFTKSGVPFAKPYRELLGDSSVVGLCSQCQSCD